MIWWREEGKKVLISHHPIYWHHLFMGRNALETLVITTRGSCFIFWHIKPLQRRKHFLISHWLYFLRWIPHAIIYSCRSPHHLLISRTHTLKHFRGSTEELLVMKMMRRWQRDGGCENHSDGHQGRPAL